MSVISLTAYVAPLTFSSDQELTTINGGSTTFTIAASGNLNGITIISRINAPTSVSFPANFEILSGSDSWSPYALNIIIFRYFSNWDGNENNKVYYMVKNQVALNGGAAFTTEMTTLLAQASSDGVSAPLLATQTLINNFIVARKLAGTFSNRIAIYLPANDGLSEAFSNYNIVSPSTYKLIKRGTTVYNSRGIKSNGTDGFYTTQIPVNAITITNVSILSSFGAISANSATKYAWGAVLNSGNTGALAFRPQNAAGNGVVFFGDFSSTIVTSADSKTMFDIGHDTGTTTKFARNGSALTTNAAITPATPNITAPMLLLALNGAITNGTETASGFYNEAELSHWEVGPLQTASEHTDSWNAINAYMQAIGVWP